MKTLLFALTALLLLPLSAQEPRNRRAPGPSSSETLTENITIRLQGSYHSFTNLDLSLTGIGPNFTADLVRPDSNNLLTCHYTVSKTEKGYLVSYVIGARVKTAYKDAQGNTRYEYRDVSLNGTTVCAPNRPVTIYKNGDQSLQFHVAEQPNNEPSTNKNDD